MNTSRHPAHSTDYDQVPSPTLVLPINLWFAHAEEISYAARVGLAADLIAVKLASQ
jgi:hypothetical protein